MARIPTLELARDSATRAPNPTVRTSPARQFTPSRLERPNGYHCPYPCRISTDALDLSKCMPFRRADWSGSCTPSTPCCSCPAPLPRRPYERPLHLASRQRQPGTVGDTTIDQCRRWRDPVLCSVARGFPSEEQRRLETLNSAPRPPLVG
jgi:hypothetical protein